MLTRNAESEVWIRATDLREQVRNILGIQYLIARDKVDDMMRRYDVDTVK